MLQAGSERAWPVGRLWVPGMTPQEAPYGAASPSARALEIARRRDEMLGMLHGLPESEYELSLTDLVEKTAVAPPPTPPSERKESGPIPSPLGKPAGLSESGRQAEQPAKTERRGSSRRRGDSGSGSGRSSFRSSSDGVLLNFYMPRSITRSFTSPRFITRSFTSPRPSHHEPSGPAAGVPDESNKRERDSDTVKCWSMPWDRRWRKSSRRDLAGGESEPLRRS